jgi:hypothetical protein
LIQEGTRAVEHAKIDAIYSYDDDEPVEIMEDLLDDGMGTEDPNMMYRSLDDEEII